MHKYTLTCWPRFPISRNDLQNQDEVKDISTLRPAPSTEFRGGSCCDSQIGWGPHICKVLPRCITAHSKTPTNLHITVLALEVMLKYIAELHEFMLNYVNLE